MYTCHVNRVPAPYNKQALRPSANKHPLPPADLNTNHSHFRATIPAHESHSHSTPQSLHSPVTPLANHSTRQSLHSPITPLLTVTPHSHSISPSHTTPTSILHSTSTSHSIPAGLTSTPHPSVTPSLSASHQLYLHQPQQPVHFSNTATSSAPEPQPLQLFHPHNTPPLPVLHSHSTITIPLSHSTSTIPHSHSTLTNPAATPSPTSTSVSPCICVSFLGSVCCGFIFHGGSAKWERGFPKT